MKRLASFDISRAIALLAVVVGHTSFAGVPTTVVDACYSFDMPLFFLVSGYFCKDVPLSREGVLKTAKSLLLPYAITSAIVIALAAARAILMSESVADALSTWTAAALYGAGGLHHGMPEGVIGIGAIWYLLALFWAKLLLTSVNQTKWPGLLSLCLFIVGIGTKDYMWLPWSVQPALCAVLFMYVGQKVRQEKLLARGAISPLLWICMFMTWAYCAAFFGHLYMESNSYGNGAIDVIGGICGSLCLLKISELVIARMGPVATFLSWIGRNTLPLFCMHLVELNIVRWDLVISYLDGCSLAIPTWAAVIGLQLILIAVLTALVFLAPRVVSGAFFASRRIGAHSA